MADGNNPPERNAVLRRRGTGQPDTLMVGQSCNQAALCYVNSTRTKMVNSRFSRSMIDRNKVSSVAVAYRDGEKNWIEGSGTLIGPNLVLTAGHCINFVKDKCIREGLNYSEHNFYVIFDYEYTSVSLNAKNPQLANFSEERVIGIKNTGHEACKDFALLVLQGPPSLGFPDRVATIRTSIVEQHENTISFQHPEVTDEEKPTHPHMVTRVSGGTVSSANCIHPGDSQHCGAIACVNHTYRHGSSGGGVFDTNMNLIGIVKGATGRTDSTRAGQPKMRFVKIANVINESKFLTQNVTPAAPYLPITTFADLSNDNP